MVKLRLFILNVLPAEGTAARRAAPASISIPASLTIAGVVIAITAVLAATVALFKAANEAKATPNPANGTNPVTAGVPKFVVAKCMYVCHSNKRGSISIT